MKKIKEIANECLNCKIKPCCLKGCPIKTQIPEFITELKNENYKKAYDILQENNICSYICSLVCPQEEQCEGSCVKGIKGEPVNIGLLEKKVNEWAIENGYEYKIEKKENNGKKVGIIGSGPAGLACAAELLKEGYEVEVYEKDKIPGGILIYGIPDFRLEKSIVEDLINKIENVFKSDEFLKAYNEKEFIENLGTVVVIGGGNVAMDSARAAIRMGADKVKILYRRDRAHMPAREIELDEAIEDGVEFKELVRVISADDKNGIIENVNCIETEIVEGKAVDKKDAKIYKEEANTVVFAIGLKPDKNLIQDQGIELDDWGYIKVNEKGRTNLENVYAGGDNTESKATVCRALAAGKRAAKGIIENLLNND